MHLKFDEYARDQILTCVYLDLDHEINLKKCCDLKGRLNSGQQLTHYNELWSDNGCFKLIMQSDGKLVSTFMNG